MAIVRIGEETLEEEDLLNFLKYTQEFQGMAQELFDRRITVIGAARMGICVTPAERQKEALAFRKSLELVTAQDMMAWLAAQGMQVEAWERFLDEDVLIRKVMVEVTSTKKIEEHFRANMPEFERVELARIRVSSVAEGKEIMAMLSEGADFDALAAGHSLDSATRNSGGRMGFVKRNELPHEAEAKVFNAGKGSIVGPFAVGEDTFDIFNVVSDKVCELDEDVSADIQDRLFATWRDAQANITDTEWL